MTPRSILVMLSVLCCLGGLDSSRILAVFPHVGKSHYFMFQPFVYHLAQRGHQVTVITHFASHSPPPNVTYISLAGDVEILYNSLDINMFENIGKLRVRPWASILALSLGAYEACDKGLQHPNLRKLLASEQKFDLVIAEFFNTDCFAFLAHHYNAPLVGIFSSVQMPWHNERFGNPDNPSYIVNHFTELSSHMTFLERCYNSLVTLSSKLLYKLLSDWPSDRLIRAHYGENVPPVSQIVANASLFLLNTHFSIFQPRPLVPGIVEIGGIHVKPPSKALPQNIKQFLDQSKNGVIYFSFGSTLKSSTMSEEKRRMIMNALKRTGKNVVWKWEDEMPDKPENFLVDKWLPQNEILAHPNVKLFVTHSGLMGTEEAVYHGVPMVMMPIIGDQPINAALCKEKGIGVIVDYFYLTEEDLYNALHNVLNEKTFADNARRVAAIFKDRPQGMLETAVYWTEYVLRYQGAYHLRSAAVDLPWYSEYLVDVFCFYLILIIGTLYLNIKITQILWSAVRRKPKSKQKRQ